MNRGVMYMANLYKKLIICFLSSRLYNNRKATTKTPNAMRYKAT